MRHDLDRGTLSMFLTGCMRILDRNSRQANVAAGEESKARVIALKSAEGGNNEVTLKH